MGTMCGYGGKQNESTYFAFRARAHAVCGGIASFDGREMAMANAGRSRQGDRLQSNGHRRHTLRVRRGIATRTAGFVLVLPARRPYLASLSAGESPSDDATLLRMLRELTVSGFGDPAHFAEESDSRVRKSSMH